MSSPSAVYPPLDVLKPVAEGIWIVDSGPLRVMGMPLPVRMTVVRLRNGGLWLHSPTRWSADLHAALEQVGPVRHLVAPSTAHWLFVKEWQDHCPTATTWGAPGLRERRPVRKAGLRLDNDLLDLPPQAWEDEIAQAVVRGGGGFREVAFLHEPSRSLLLADLVVNLEPAKLPRAARPLARLAGMMAPHGRAPAYLRLLIRLRRHEAREAAARLVAWEPERVIFAHGAWFERDGAAALRRSLSWLLPGGMMAEE